MNWFKRVRAFQIELEFGSVNNNNNNNNNNEYLYRIALQCKSTVIKGVLS